MSSQPPTNVDPGSGTGQKLYRRARARIPGGAQLLGKRPEQYLPGGWPAYYSRAQGCTIWDMDDRPYLDFTSNGIGTCLLGYADPVVNAAVTDCVARGNMCTLNAPAEVELADLLCAIHPWATKVRYARTGGEAMSISVRIARAHTRRGVVAFCGYHGWNDWYLAANLGATDALNGHLLPGLDPDGVPRALLGSALPFRYNQIGELEQIVATHRSELLIFDEITAGWRSNHGGMHLTMGVSPDIAVFAKAMSNGFPMSAIIGRDAVMDAAQQTFISSTYWTESIGPTAAVATLARLEQLKVARHVDEIGSQVRAGWTAAAARTGLTIKVIGIPALCILGFDAGEGSRAVMTLFTQEMLSRGFLAAGGLYPTYAHKADLVSRYLAAVEEVFGLLKDHLDRGSVLKALHGPVAQSGFARLT